MLVARSKSKIRVCWRLRLTRNWVHVRWFVLTLVVQRNLQTKARHRKLIAIRLVTFWPPWHSLSTFIYLMTADLQGPRERNKVPDPLHCKGSVKNKFCETLEEEGLAFRNIGAIYYSDTVQSALQFFLHFIFFRVVLAALLKFVRKFKLQPLAPVWPVV